MPTNSYSNLDMGGGGGGASSAEVDALIELSGVPAESVDLGTFTGTIIPDGSTIKEALQALETAEMGEALWDRTGTTLSPQTANDNVDIGTGKYTGGNLDINALSASSQNPSIGRSGPDSIAAELLLGDTESATWASSIINKIIDTTGSNTVAAILRAQGDVSTRKASARAICQSDVPRLELLAERPSVASQITLHTNAAYGIEYIGDKDDLTVGVMHKFSTGGAISGTCLVADFQNNGSSVLSISNGGNVALTGTVDGRDVAADGTKIDRYISPVRAAMAADDINFQTDYVLTKTLSGNTTLTASNVILGKTILLEIQSAAAETLALPAGTVTLEGTYDTSGVVNYIFLLCNNTTGPTFLAVIKQGP